MPLYMDIHQVEGLTAEELAKAHTADLLVQADHGVEYVKYWFNEGCGKVFCLVNAPSAEAAHQVHQEAHGVVAEKIIEVDPDFAEGFLGGGDVNAAGAVMAPQWAGAKGDPGIRSVLFTDIVGSTELTQRIGDEAAMEIIRLHDQVVRSALAENRGREVKHTGDGIMAAFFSAVAAVKCASQIQQALDRYRRENPGSELNVCIGVAAGEPVEQRDDLFGSTVQLAARLCSHAKPDQTLISNVVAELCVGKGLHFDDMGEAELKGFTGPVRIHAVRFEQLTG